MKGQSGSQSVLGEEMKPINRLSEIWTPSLGNNQTGFNKNLLSFPEEINDQNLSPACNSLQFSDAGKEQYL